jgi:3-hydroxyacyl-CoA dehydrogenase
MQVIEAVIEHIPLKQQIFQELEAVCSKDCILSTNTSTIDIDLCAAKMKEPHRIVGPPDPASHFPADPAACSLPCA